MTLKEEWDRLDSETRHWLLDNPGCPLVPNTITARMGLLVSLVVSRFYVAVGIVVIGDGGC
jgi:hypothetical protein